MGDSPIPSAQTGGERPNRGLSAQMQKRRPSEEGRRLLIDDHAANRVIN